MRNPLRRRPAPGEIADPDHGLADGEDGTFDDTADGWDFDEPETDVHEQEG